MSVISHSMPKPTAAQLALSKQAAEEKAKERSAAYKRLGARFAEYAASNGMLIAGSGGGSVGGQGSRIGGGRSRGGSSGGGGRFFAGDDRGVVVAMRTGVFAAVRGSVKPYAAMDQVLSMPTAYRRTPGNQVRGHDVCYVKWGGTGNDNCAMSRDSMHTGVNTSGVLGKSVADGVSADHSAGDAVNGEHEEEDEGDVGAADSDGESELPGGWETGSEGLAEVMEDD